jgi:hypothetical protein
MLFISDNGKERRGSAGALEASHSLPASLSSSHFVSASLSYLVLSAPCQPALSVCPYLTVLSTNILVNRRARRMEGGVRKYVGGGE